ncbi:MAG: formylglycine-generating enzyme family protein [Anaerolineae bacterium]|nr:formylglycine-generating enzyme family protein [Anaerolineae bacterium]
MKLHRVPKSNLDRVHAIVLRLLSLVCIFCTGLWISLPSSTVGGQEPVPTSIPIGTVVKDSLGVEMVYVPSGTFEFGVTQEQLQAFCKTELPEDNLEKCVITLGDDTGASDFSLITMASYWIDRYEVTIEQYQPCIADRSGACDEVDLSRHPALTDDLHKPQIGVSWYDAMRFCNMRGARLPTEEEWEYAASGPKNLNFPWGDTFVQQYASHTGKYPPKVTYKVGTIAGNKSWIGAFDMAGNAAEWVDARYLPRRLSTNLPLASAMLSSLETSRVIRGGSWEGRKFTLTTFYREAIPPEATFTFIGFRCVRSSDPRS